jgi:GDP-L-fucose synthase
MKNFPINGGKLINIMINLAKKKILVAGGDGFVGKSVVSELQERNLNVVSLSITDGYDFRNFETTRKLFEKERFDAVINCAAFVGGLQFCYQHPGEIFYNNVIMGTYLMEAARLAGVKRFVNPISNCSYPNHLKVHREDEWWSGPLHESVVVYGMARKISWVQGLAYKQQYGFDSIHLILPSMYGPGDHFDLIRSHALGSLIMKFVEAKRKRQPEVVIWGSGKPVREWLYVQDGAEALIKALEIEPQVEPINIGIGKGISILELAKTIKDVVGYEGNITLDESKPDGSPYRTMDVANMKRIFNWSPQTVLKDGIEKTVLYYEKNF